MSIASIMDTLGVIKITNAVRTTKPVCMKNIWDTHIAVSKLRGASFSTFSFFQKF